MISLFNTYISPKAKQLVQDTLNCGFINQGPRVEEFENRLSDFGLYRPLTVNSCTSGLYMCLKAIGVEGKPVLIGPQTFIATGMAVLQAGGLVEFGDVDYNGNLELPKDISKYGAIICTWWGGVPPLEYKEMANRCSKAKIPLIIDGAHALGTILDGKRLGSRDNICDFVIFSMQAIKSLTCGDGGIIVYGNYSAYNKYDSKLRKMRWFGIDKSMVERGEEGGRGYLVNDWGGKFHINDIAASIGIGNLENLKDRLNKRRIIALRYFAAFHPPNNGIYPPISMFQQPSWWLYTLRVKDRLNFIRKMKSAGIECSIVDEPITVHPIFGRSETWREEFPNLNLFSKEMVCIPCHEGLNDEQVTHIISAIKAGW